MLNENQKHEDDEVDEQPVHDPYIHEFDAGGLRQFRGDRAVESVHDQHGSDGHWDARLEMLCLEIQGDLEEGKLVSIQYR